VRAASLQNDPFKKMLLWSLVIHSLLFTTIALGGWLVPDGNVLPPPGADMFISLGDSGPGAGGGSGAPPKPEPEAEPPPEPPRSEPKVVRPTVEQRDEIPAPDAPEKRSRRFEPPEQDSGLRGQDASPKESADLETGGTGRAGIGLGGAGGGSPFDQDFEYAYYVKTMLGRIHQHWQRTAVRGHAVVVVRFTIMKDGSVQDASVEQSSGVSILDRGSLRAVMLADPLPPLPNSYSRDRVGVHLRFTYSDKY
jgi:protein TonB